MTEFQALVEKIWARHDSLKHMFTHLSRPMWPDGTWWLDVTFEDKKLCIQWTEAHGFGLSDMRREDIGYGEGPDEVYLTADVTYERIDALLKGQS